MVKRWSGDVKTEVRPEEKPTWREESNISLIVSSKWDVIHRNVMLLGADVSQCEDVWMFNQNRIRCAGSAGHPKDVQNGRQQLR